MEEELKEINTHNLKMNVQSGYIDVEIPNATLTITKRPVYCDRGRYGVMIFPNPNQFKIHIDAADGFPRYFFSLQRLFDEINDWAIFNNEVVR